jgi:hypothetical protein
MQAYALVTDLAPSEAVELYLREEDALHVMREVLHNEPGWRDLLHVLPVELIDATPSSN